MYDHNEYEAELHENGSIETRLKRVTEPSTEVRLVVMGPDLIQVSAVARKLRDLLKGAK